MQTALQANFRELQYLQTFKYRISLSIKWHFGSAFVFCYPKGMQEGSPLSGRDSGSWSKKKCLSNFLARTYYLITNKLLR